MNPITLLVCFVSLAFVSYGNEWSPPRDFLQAVREVESSNGLKKYGDNGESLGDFQLSEAAWLDVNEWRRARSLKTYQYDQSALHSYINRVYASNYLTILYGELNKKLRRTPSPGELYAAYNLGLATFAQCDFNLSRVNPVTRAKCRQIGMLLAAKEST
jgi:hypothetical protein